MAYLTNCKVNEGFRVSTGDNTIDVIVKRVYGSKSFKRAEVVVSDGKDVEVVTIERYETPYSIREDLRVGVADRQGRGHERISLYCDAPRKYKIDPIRDINLTTSSLQPIS